MTPEPPDPPVPATGGSDAPSEVVTEFDVDGVGAAIRSAIGGSGWSPRGEIASALVDFRRVFVGEAIGLARPSTTGEVAEVVRICIEHDLAIVTQGGNTGLSGGAIPAPVTHDDPRPRLILSLARLDEIGEVDLTSDTVVAGAGVRIEALQELAASHDRLFAPDWGARGSATVGGAISTNAGGINVVKHGNLREHVLGVEAVLADGRIWNGLRRLPKDNSGFDLKQLFIGGEGTIGIVTRAVMRLSPRPAAQHLAMAGIPGLDALNDLFALARSHDPGALSAFELVPDVGVAQVVERYDVQRPLTTTADWYVLIRYDSRSDDPQDSSTSLVDLLTIASDRELITDAVVASSDAQEHNLWTMRDELTATRSFGGFGVKYDLAVPPSRIAEFVGRADAVVQEIVPGALSFVFGHVGDGNLHFTVLTPDRDDDELVAAAPRITSSLDALVWDFDGTISAEHGLGRELRERIVGQKDDVEFELMRRIKDAFDPHHRLNPAVMLPPD